MSLPDRLRSTGRAGGATGSPWFDAALFAVVAAILIAIDWSSIVAHNVEYSDFAANSVLIQYAKAGRLWIGNYSRVGFNHPGPAILDILALGEAILFDRLHWVPSPFSGQLVAVALYDAFWIVLIVRLWRSFGPSRFAAYAGAAGFVVATGLLDVRFLSGPWFPHLYYFPFAVFLFAATRLGTGRSDRLQTLALSTGFLMNGHVAFVPICVAILSVVVVANRAAFGRTDRERIVSSARWLHLHGRRLLFAALTLVLFAVPLIVETWRRFPGPIGDYLAFGGGHHHNNLIRSLRFVSMYWGGLPYLLLPVAFVAIGLRLRLRDAEWLHTVRAMIAVVAGASLALLLYASFGVDVLSSAYIGYFYCAVPALVLALCVALCVASARQDAGPSRMRSAAVAVGAVAFAAACWNLPRENDYRGYYHGAAIVDLYDALHDADRDGRLVLDLEDWPGLQTVWPVVVGIEAHALRRREDLLCVGRNWHILFSIQARCSAEEIASARHVVVRNTTSATKADETLVAEGLGVSFYRVP